MIAVLRESGAKRSLETPVVAWWLSLDSCSKYSNHPRHTKEFGEIHKLSHFCVASTVKGDGNASAPIIVTTDQDSKLLKNLRCLAIKKRKEISY